MNAADDSWVSDYDAADLWWVPAESDGLGAEAVGDYVTTDCYG